MIADIAILNNIMPLNNVDDVAQSITSMSEPKQKFSLELDSASNQAANLDNLDSKVQSQDDSLKPVIQTDIKQSHSKQPADSKNNQKSQKKQTKEQSNQTQSNASVNDDSDSKAQSKIKSGIIRLVADTVMPEHQEASVKTQEICLNSNPVIDNQPTTPVLSSMQPSDLAVVSLEAGRLTPDVENIIGNQPNVMNQQQQINDQTSSVLPTPTRPNYQGLVVPEIPVAGNSTLVIQENPAAQSTVDKTLFANHPNNNGTELLQRVLNTDIKPVQPQVTLNNPQDTIEQLKNMSATRRQDISEKLMSDEILQDITNTLQKDTPAYQYTLRTIQNQVDNLSLDIQQPAPAIESRTNFDFQMPSGLLEQTTSPVKQTGIISQPPAINSGHSSTVADVGRQILDSIHSSLSVQGSDNQITVRLNPPELGHVVIRFQGKETQMTGVLEVSNTQIRAEVEHSLPQIVRNLADSGIEVKRLEVVLSNNSNSDSQSQKEQYLFNGEHQQHNWHDGTNDSSYSGSQEQDNGQNYNTVYPQDDPANDIFATDNSINILL
jgi:flagellar hook-length control protein FliK